MRFRDRPLLIDGIDADLYVERPNLERRLLDEVLGDRNVLLVGPRGSGKTTTLRRLAADLREHDRKVAPVNAGVARSTSDLLALIADGLDLPQVEPDANLATPVVTLVRAVRHLAAAPASVILLLDPVDINSLFELFGRLREEVWALPHHWVVEVSSEQSGALRQPPADAFFSAVLEIPPLDEQEIEQLLRRGLEEDEARVVLQQPKRPLTDYPRDVVRFARSTLDGTFEGEQNAARRREAIAAGLGRPAHMALAEIEARGAPIAAADPAFLERMGWSRPHAARTLAMMERAGLLRGFNDTSDDRPGRPRKLYEPNPDPPR